MKKISLLLAVILALCLVGCGKGLYKEGVYEGSVIDNYNNENNTATAKITVSENGKIESVYLDTTYTTQAGTKTTKKTLKDDYNMKKYKQDAAGEWYEQVEKLEKAIVDKQEITFLDLDDEGYTDAVAGCTIKIDAMYKALEEAINKAKK